MTAPRVGERIRFEFQKWDPLVGIRGGNRPAYWDLGVVAITHAADDESVVVELHTPRGESVAEWSAYYRRHVEGRE